METEWFACFFCLEFEQFDCLEQTLLKYDIGEYAIAYESEDSKGDPKPHFHLLFSGTQQIYNNFSKVIVDKFKLRRSGHGGKNKYGKVKEIRDLDKMLYYTVKHKRFRTNMNESKIQHALENSFVKKKSQENCKVVLEKIDKWLNDDYTISLMNEYNNFNKKLLKNKIIEVCVECRIPLSEIRLKSYFWYVLNNSEADNIKINRVKIFQQILINW